MIYSDDFDVVVLGGGVSGCGAAVSAAKLGSKVLMIEKSGYLGGTLTGNGVGPMMTFHAGDKQVIKGFMQDVVDKLIAYSYSNGHVADTKQYVSTVTPFDSEGLKIVLDEMTTEVNVKLLFHTFVGEVTRVADKIVSVTVCNKDGINQVKGKIFIDATGDGDIASWSGLKMTKGRESDGAAQPMTLKAKYCGADTNELKDYVIKNIEKFPKIKPHLDIFKEDIPIDLEGFDEEFAAEKKAGNVTISRENILMFGTTRKGEYIFNTTRVIGKDSTSAISLSEAEVEGRKQCKELDAFIRKHVPGFKDALLEFTGPSIGIRGSRQLVGQYTLTAEDILEQKKFDDVIAHSGYPIDIHNPSGAGTMSTFMNDMGSYYNIPLRIMITNEVANLIVTGRCASATFEAQASIRLTPSAGAMGQAAGVLASISTNGDVRKQDAKKVQTILKEQGAYIEV